jgi:hypothetical protein
VGSALLAGLYLGIVSWAESSEHAFNLFLEDSWIVVPILLGFGIQVGLYATVRRRRMEAKAVSSAGPLMGAGGTTSTVAMAACCVHHVTDALPLLGLSAGAAFLAEYRIPFMLIGLLTNLLGIGVMLRQLLRLRSASALPSVLVAEAA